MDTPLLIALPKGRMADGVRALLADAGIELRAGDRGYRPTGNVSWLSVKLLKPQNIVGMLAAGSRDVGFAGADWVAETGADVVEILDTGLDPVRVVAAAPATLLVDGELPDRPLRIASEYGRLTARWVEERRVDMTFVRSYGATEVFPPEDADLIVDNTASGATLRANGLQIIDELMRSSTRLYACPAALRDPGKSARIDELVLLLTSVLEARRRVMVEVNVGVAQLEAVIGALPCMREATISPLFRETGFAVKAAVPRDGLAALIPTLKTCGATDIVVSAVAQIVP